MTINDRVAVLGDRASDADRICLDGKPLELGGRREAVEVLLYHKPVGEVTTRADPENRPTVFERLPPPASGRWIVVGRLDVNTSGLLLFTNDGDLAHRLMHPSSEISREYLVRLRGSPSEAALDRLRRGVELDDGPASFDEIHTQSTEGSHTWLRVCLHEGRNREVRRLWESQGCQVSRLKRTRYGSIELPQPLLRGHSQEVATERVEELRKSLGLEDGAPSALTLQPVIGQRRAAKSTVHVGGQHRSQGYVGGHNTADEGRELRRFDHVREDRRGRGGKKPHGGLTVSGEAAANQANKAFKPKGPRQPGQRMGRDKGPGQENPAAFRTWYVPDGVETGPAGHRNPDGARGPRRGPGRNGPPAGGRPQRGPGGGGARGNAQPGGGGRSAHPYGHPGNAPVFPSDHATPGFNPYGERPRTGRPGGHPGGNRPGGNRAGGPGGNRPGGGRPGGNGPGGNGPGGHRPGGPRPAGGGRGRPGGGNRGPQGR